MLDEKLNLGILVRHPAPFPAESLAGYVLRLAELNGYTSPWRIYVLAGIAHSRMLSANQTASLARIANLPVAELQTMAYYPPIALPRIPCLLGNRVRPTDLRQRAPRICLSCVEEKGFIETHWELSIMIGCPIHRCIAQTQCPGCRKPLSWFRRGLLECSCGATLVETTPPLDGRVCALLDVVRRRALELNITPDHPLGAAAKPLHSMSLHSLLGVIRVLGSRRLMADQAADVNRVEMVTRAAADVFFDWPNNFFRLLRSIGNPKQVKGTSVVSQFKGIYQHLFHTGAATDT